MSGAASQHQRIKPLFPMLLGSAPSTGREPLEHRGRERGAGRGSGWQGRARGRSREERARERERERSRARERRRQDVGGILEASKVFGCVLIVGWLLLSWGELLLLLLLL